MGALKNMAGQRVGRLLVVERADNDKHGCVMWKCQCDCGRFSIVSRTNLISGRVNSCGCLSEEKTRERSITHGQRRSRLYGVWANMKSRCYNPKTHNYPRYGGRGITICDEWRNDFQAFYQWAMANGYDERAPYMQCTIDRIDNDRGYSPDNCRWVSAKIQSNNKSNNRKVQKDENN